MAAEGAPRRRQGRGAGRGADARRRLDGLARYLASRESERFDRLIYERVRLGIVSALAVNPEMSFTELRDLLDTTDGNLSAHARKLEEAGYVECEKSFVDRVPRTAYRLTNLGREALERYLTHMERLIHATRGD
jgi:DNA-binding MarR family transcriptional regulator